MEFKYNFFIILKSSHFFNFIQYFYGTALILAAESGYTEIARLLLMQEGIDINAKNV